MIMLTFQTWVYNLFEYSPNCHADEYSPNCRADEYSPNCRANKKMSQISSIFIDFCLTFLSSIPLILTTSDLYNFGTKQDIEKQ